MVVNVIASACIACCLISLEACLLQETRTATHTLLSASSRQLNIHASKPAKLLQRVMCIRSLNKTLLSFKYAKTFSKSNAYLNLSSKEQTYLLQKNTNKAAMYILLSASIQRLNILYSKQKLLFYKQSLKP